MARDVTRQRNDNHSTEFGLWIREVKELGSDKHHGYVTSNLDFIWTNYKSNLWMLIEEKRHMSLCNFPQTAIYKTLHESISCDKYKGTHLIQFEKTNPDDGNIFINSKRVTTKGLIRFLSFEKEVLDYFGLPDFL